MLFFTSNGLEPGDNRMKESMTINICFLNSNHLCKGSKYTVTEIWSFSKIVRRNQRRYLFAFVLIDETKEALVLDSVTKRRKCNKGSKFNVFDRETGLICNETLLIPSGIYPISFMCIYMSKLHVLFILLQQSRCMMHLITMHIRLH